MNKTRKILNILLGLGCVISLLFIFLIFNISNITVFAEKNTNEISACISEMFNDKKINSFDPLLSVDGEEEFLYFEFEDGGYAIFIQDTMELLEYGSLFQINIKRNN